VQCILDQRGTRDRSPRKREDGKIAREISIQLAPPPIDNLMKM